MLEATDKAAGRETTKAAAPERRCLVSIRRLAIGRRACHSHCRPWLPGQEKKSLSAAGGGLAVAAAIGCVVLFAQQSSAQPLAVHDVDGTYGRESRCNRAIVQRTSQKSNPISPGTFSILHFTKLENMFPAATATRARQHLSAQLSVHRIVQLAHPATQPQAIGAVHLAPPASRPV